MGPKRRSSLSFDETEAFDASLEYEMNDIVFVDPKLKNFLDKKSRQHAVETRMFLSSMIGATSNAMGVSKLAFTPDWEISSNIYIVGVSPKGSGKTPAGKLFLGALLDLERAEKEAYDEDIEDQKKKKKIKKLTERARKKNSVVGPVMETDEDESGDNARKRKANPALDVDENSNVDKERRSKKEALAKLSEGAFDSEDDKAAFQNKDDSSEQFNFHPKNRIMECITPEALFLSLFHGSGVLLLKSDEYKGLYDKIEKQDNISCFCSAWSGEEMMNCTVKRGSLTVYENRLTLVGALQPGPLGEMLNKPDPQGYFDRHIFLPADRKQVQLLDRLQPIEDKDKVDIGKLLRTIRGNHLVPRTYTVEKTAMEEFLKVDEELRKLNEKAQNGNECSGMTQKAMGNVQKLSIIYCCLRENLNHMMDEESEADEDGGVPFMVLPVDVQAGWDVVQQSMHTLKHFKISLGEEFGNKVAPEEAFQEAADEEIITAGAFKIKLMYDKAAATGGEILLSQCRRDKLFPKMCSFDAFLKALIGQQIATKTTKKGGNKVVAEVLTLTMSTTNRDVVKTFQYLFKLLLGKGIYFDPMKMFGEKEELM